MKSSPLKKLQSASFDLIVSILILKRHPLNPNFYFSDIKQSYSFFEEFFQADTPSNKHIIDPPFNFNR